MQMLDQNSSKNSNSNNDNKIATVTVVIVFIAAATDHHGQPLQTPNTKYQNIIDVSRGLRLHHDSPESQVTTRNAKAVSGTLEIHLKSLLKEPLTSLIAVIPEPSL